MSDLISRQDAIDALAKFVPYVINDISTESYTNGLIDAYNLICQLPSVNRSTGKWIPCSERLPKDNKEVLISCEWGVDIGEHSHDGWGSEWINHYDDDNVLAWMPLPELYKGGDTE